MYFSYLKEEQLMQKKIFKSHKFSLKRRAQGIIQQWEREYSLNEYPGLPEEDELEAKKNSQIDKFINMKISEIEQRKRGGFRYFCLSFLSKRNRDTKLMHSKLRSRWKENRNREVIKALAETFHFEDLRRYSNSIFEQLFREEDLVDFSTVITILIIIIVACFNPFSNMVLETFRVSILLVGTGLTVIKSMDKVKSHHMEFKAKLSQMAVDEIESRPTL
jgi:hypothetical protein